MPTQSSDADRRLREYPISLRQSARAVFGEDYARDERRAQHAALHGCEPVKG